MEVLEVLFFAVDLIGNILQLFWTEDEIFDFFDRGWTFVKELARRSR